MTLCVWFLAQVVLFLSVWCIARLTRRRCVVSGATACRYFSDVDGVYVWEIFNEKVNERTTQHNIFFAKSKQNSQHRTQQNHQQPHTAEHTALIHIMETSFCKTTPIRSTVITYRVQDLEVLSGGQGEIGCHYEMKLATTCSGEVNTISSF